MGCAVVGVGGMCRCVSGWDVQVCEWVGHVGQVCEWVGCAGV